MSDPHHPDDLNESIMETCTALDAVARQIAALPRHERNTAKHLALIVDLSRLKTQLADLMAEQERLLSALCR